MNEREIQTPSQDDGNTQKKKKNAVLGVLLDILRGAAIGVAFIIPGFSGGSVAAILGVYEKLVGAVTEFFKSFKKSMRVLLPTLLGMILGVAALIFPIRWGLKNFPIPTVCLFVGLALGGLPSITEKMKGGKPRAGQIISLILAAGAAAALCFIPNATKQVELFSLSTGGYFLLVVIGIVASCALVVPGISGSMLLLIFGYYNPVVDLILNNLLHGIQVGKCLLVLGCLAAGIVIGFFAISYLMRFLLKKFPRATYFAIFGFIVGSVPAVFVQTIASAPPQLSTLYAAPFYWISSVCLLAIGVAMSLFLVHLSRDKRKEKNTEKQDEKIREQI